MIAQILQNISKVKSNRSVLLGTLFLTISLFNANITSADTGINPQIPYSGTIVKNDGTVLLGTYNVKFIVYDSEILSAQSNIKYEETRSLEIRDGRFEVLLGGQGTTLSTVNDDSLWLELQLDLNNDTVYEEVFAPRKRIGSSLYSVNSMRLVANGGVSTNTLSLDSIGNLVFTGDSATERMRITGTGNLTLTGVNITASALGGEANTITPAGFDRVLLANISGQFSQVNLSSLTSGYLTTSTGWALAGNSTTDAWNGTSGSRVGTTSSWPLVLATTNSAPQDIQFFTGVNGANERMRILGTGNIGIGTTNPSQRLQIEGGNLLIGIASSGIAGQLQLRNPANTFQTNIQAGAQTADITYTLPTSAGSNLQVLSTNGSGVLSWITTGSSTGWALTGNSGTNPTSNYIGTSDAQALSIRANGRERMRILSGVSGADSTIVVGDFEGTTSSTANRTAIIRAASPSATGSSNAGGADLNIRGGYSTGSNVGGDIIFATTSAGSIGGTPNNYTERMRILGNGNININTTSGSSLTNIGRVVLSAGTATANTAPLKFTAGTNLTTAEAGAVEWNGTNLFLTTSGGVRQTINQGLTATATLDFPSTNDNSFNNLTVTVTGAVIGDVVTLGIPNASVPAGASNFTAWVSTTNTVTVRFSNHSGVAQDPASGSFKIFVTKF